MQIAVCYPRTHAHNRAHRYRQVPRTPGWLTRCWPAVLQSIGATEARQSTLSRFIYSVSMSAALSGQLTGTVAVSSPAVYAYLVALR